MLHHAASVWNLQVMTIHLRCPNPKCRQVLRVADEHAGDQLACPACQQIFQVPRPSVEKVGIQKADSRTSAELQLTASAKPPFSAADKRHQSSFLFQLMSHVVLAVLFLGVGVAGTYVFLSRQREAKPSATPKKQSTPSPKKQSPSPPNEVGNGVDKSKYDALSEKLQRASKRIGRLTKSLEEANGERDWRKIREQKLYKLLAEGKHFHEFIDWHALLTPAGAEKAIPSLVAFVTSGLHSDEAKVRAFFRWITEKIELDVPAFRTGKWDQQPLKKVFAERKGLCSGYAELFQEMCKFANIECKLVYGIATGPDVDPKKLPTEPNHVWNVVKIDGQWKLIDATRGAGLFRKDEYNKEVQEFYFFPDPDRLIFTHFPKEAKWQLTTVPVTKEQFAKLITLKRPKRFLQKDLLKQVLEAVNNKDNDGFVDVLAGIEKVKVLAAPVTRQLTKGKNYKFHFQAPGFEKMVLVVPDKKPKVQGLARFGDQFLGKITVTKGPISVAGLEPGAKSYTVVLEYKVK